MRLIDARRLYFNHMLALGRSHLTVRGAKSALKQLLEFLCTLGVQTVAQLDRDALMRYREELAWRLTPKGVPLAVRSQLELLGHIAAFCRFGVAQGWWLADPSETIPRPKKPARLPRSIMDTGEVERLLKTPDTGTLRGFRNLVMLEVLYSTALRREELANLRLDDVDVDGGYVFVREGKGGKDRVVPLGASVADRVRSYLVDIRPRWPGVGKDPHLFLNRWGRGMGPNSVGAVVKRCARGAQLAKPVATHTLRHSCATHMLRNGAPVRQLQEMLGHASLETTQLYTRVTINDLRSMHAKFHPREQEPQD
jgi:integrase/recombinase XerD